MDYLEQSLKAAEEALNAKTAEQFEQEYLSIKSGIGPTVESLLDYDKELCNFAVFSISKLEFVESFVKREGLYPACRRKILRLENADEKFNVDSFSETSLYEAA